MKFILFCNLPYAFSILKPLEEEIVKRGFEYIWYVPDALKQLFPYKQSTFTSEIENLKTYESDVIFVPGNEVPHFLQGIKTQIFHGLAGEKKGHFRIRDYFDLYLTQGPYFTHRFEELAKKHKDFEVKESGWCKLDGLYKTTDETLSHKERLLLKYGVKKIVLYAPTFSPSLTSGLKLLSTIETLSSRDDTLVIIKFHDKMDNEIQEKYQNIQTKNLLISDEKDITKLLQISDLMISDTSSVVYEFVLLDKPVITLQSKSENINWLNLLDEKGMEDTVISVLRGADEYKDRREDTIQKYHPYSDGKSAQRMIDAVVEYKKIHGIPKKRKLSLLRKLKIYKKYGGLF